MKLSYYLPSSSLDNDKIASHYNDPKWSAPKIYRKTGIRSRHVVKDELVSDLAVGAAERLFSEYGIDRSTV
ncbi:MAG: 3-oxoacyl-ACP synthase, partial [Aminivibrio sp.]|nr:3-oxoacyl-ACP synthase [Aminivibrio sp.]